VSERWIVIPRWQEFQHYKDRDPFWIKTYVRLIRDDNYLDLDLPARGLLHGIWLMRAQAGGPIRESAVKRLLIGGHIGRTTGNIRRHIGRHLESLNQAGWVVLCSSEQIALEKEIEIEKELSKGKSRKPTEPPAPAPVEPAVPAEAPIRFIPNLSSYTGCRAVRGEVGIGHVYDPFGTERPPSGWPYPRPTRDEIAAALAEQEAA